MKYLLIISILLTLFFLSIKETDDALGDYKYIQTNFLPVAEEREYEEKEFTITAYNVGDKFQNDDTPCIGSATTNICDAVDRGQCIVASTDTLRRYDVVGINEVVCRVEDRLNPRYNGQNRLDIAFPNTPKGRKQAREWGIKRNVLVKIYK